MYLLCVCVAFNFWPWCWYSIQNYARMGNRIVRGALNVQSMCALAHADIPLLPPGYRLVMVMAYSNGFVDRTPRNICASLCTCVCVCTGISVDQTIWLCVLFLCVFLSTTIPFTSPFLSCSLILIYFTLSLHRSHSRSRSNSRRRTNVCIHTMCTYISQALSKCIFVLSRSNFLFDA